MIQDRCIRLTSKKAAGQTPGGFLIPDVAKSSPLNRDHGAGHHGRGHHRPRGHGAVGARG